MNMTNLKNKAKDVGVKPGSLKKTDLIREVQLAEGYEDCLGRIEFCHQINCCFRADCVA